MAGHIFDIFMSLFETLTHHAQSHQCVFFLEISLILYLRSKYLNDPFIFLAEITARKIDLEHGGTKR